MRCSDPKRLGKNTIRLPDEVDGREFIFYQNDGGLRATDYTNDPMATIYYLGVIDILTPYSVIKKAEHFWKGMRADRVCCSILFVVVIDVGFFPFQHKISPVPPAEYADRFFAFMKAIMRGGEGGEAFVERSKEAGEKVEEHQ